MNRLACSLCCIAAILWPICLKSDDRHNPEPKPKTITIQHKTMEVIQATWSAIRTQDSESTHFLLTNLSKGKIFELTQDGLLWATSGAFPLDNDGDVGFLIVSQVGAKTMDAKVVGALTTGDVKQIAEWSGFEITTTKTQELRVLVKVREVEIPHGIPKFYAWDGKSMVDVSSKHPELYRQEIKDIEDTIRDPDNLPAYYYAEECRDIALALSYSHDDKMARHSARRYGHGLRVVDLYEPMTKVNLSSRL